MKRAALHNLGCKVNAYEGEAMRQLLEEAGYEIVPFREKADVYIVNTCSVTNIASGGSGSGSRMLCPISGRGIKKGSVCGCAGGQ